MSRDVRLDANWLLLHCQQHLIAAQNDDIFTPLNLSESILALVDKYSGRSTDHESRLEAELFDLLGMEGLDFITSIIKHSSDLRLIQRSDLRFYAAAANDNNNINTNKNNTNNYKKHHGNDKTTNNNDNHKDSQWRSKIPSLLHRTRTRVLRVS